MKLINAQKPAPKITIQPTRLVEKRKAEKAVIAVLRQQRDAVHKETEQLILMFQEEKHVCSERQVRTSERKAWRGRKRS